MENYEVAYNKNVNKGSAKAIITGIGNGYGGTKTVRFRIVQHDLHWEWKEDIAEKISNFFHNFF